MAVLTLHVSFVFNFKFSFPDMALLVLSISSSIS